MHLLRRAYVMKVSTDVTVRDVKYNLPRYDTATDYIWCNLPWQRFRYYPFDPMQDDADSPLFVYDHEED